MPIKNYTTSIAVQKTVGEIIGHLSRRGVVNVSARYSDDGTPEGVGFTMRTEYGYREFHLPVRVDGILAAMKKDPEVKPAQRNPDQAARVAWRIATDWLETVVALVEADLASLDEVMMPYMVDASGQRTMFSLYRETQLALDS